jgi:branched-subunit amino acid ABC-type transport system permease component
MLTRTRTGRALRAIADDVEGAQMVGIRIDRLVMVAFALAGAIAMLAAVAAAPSTPFSSDSGTLLGVKGLIAAVAVGFSSPLRAFGAGLALGVVESAIANGSVAGHALGPRYATLIPIAVGLMLLEVTRRRAEAPAE